MRGRSGSVPRRGRITPVSNRVCSMVGGPPIGSRHSSTSLRQNGHQSWPPAQARPAPPVRSMEAMNRTRKTLSLPTHSAPQEFRRHNFPVRHISELIAMWSCSMAEGDCGKADNACMHRVLLAVSQAPSFHLLPTGFAQTISNHSCTYLLQLPLVEKRSWSTSCFIGRHHRNFVGTLVCQLNVFQVPVVGRHQYAILRIEGTCASKKL